MSNSRHSAYIAGPIRDTVFLIAAPLVAILIFVPFRVSDIMNVVAPTESRIFKPGTLRDAFISVVIFSHLFIVFFRSHLNRDVFHTHPYRFVAGPIVLFLALMLSNRVLGLVAILAVWWDVYHSALQTFGIGRIYDMKLGNNPNVGRRLDWWLNLILYIGPILGGTSLALHLTITQQEAAAVPGLPQEFLDWVPANASGYGPVLSWVMLGIGIPFIAYYVYAYWRLSKNGYEVSYQKVALFAIVALVSIGAWGFNSFGEAFFVMNFFHAWQYFFLVWFIERNNITVKLGLSQNPFGQELALALFVSIGVLVGVWFVVDLPAVQFDQRTMISLLLVISILHFWYDGFIWSVRKGQVK